MNSYVYVGNRSSCLKGILDQKIFKDPIKIFVLENSYLHKELEILKKNNYAFYIFKSKEQLHKELQRLVLTS